MNLGFMISTMLRTMGCEDNDSGWLMSGERRIGRFSNRMIQERRDVLGR